MTYKRWSHVGASSILQHCILLAPILTLMIYSGCSLLIKLVSDATNWCRKFFYVYILLYWLTYHYWPIRLLRNHTANFCSDQIMSQIWRTRSMLGTSRICCCPLIEPSGFNFQDSLSLFWHHCIYYRSLTGTGGNNLEGSKIHRGEIGKFGNVNPYKKSDNRACWWVSNNAVFWKSQTNSVNDSMIWLRFDWIFQEIPVKNWIVGILFTCPILNLISLNVILYYFVHVCGCTQQNMQSLMKCSGIFSLGTH